jgi:hypothetical protein
MLNVYLTTATSMKIMVFWDVTPCSFVHSVFRMDLLYPLSGLKSGSSNVKTDERATSFRTLVPIYLTLHCIQNGVTTQKIISNT